jgi:hypothetical protein
VRCQCGKRAADHAVDGDIAGSPTAHFSGATCAPGWPSMRRCSAPRQPSRRIPPGSSARASPPSYIDDELSAGIVVLEVLIERNPGGGHDGPEPYWRVFQPGRWQVAGDGMSSKSDPDGALPELRLAVRRLSWRPVGCVGNNKLRVYRLRNNRGLGTHRAIRRPVRNLEYDHDRRCDIGNRRLAGRHGSRSIERKRRMS